MRHPLTTCALLLLLSPKQTYAQTLEWNADEPVRDDPLRCEAAQVSTPAACVDPGTLCMAQRGGECPDGCSDGGTGEDDVCVGTAECAPPRYTEGTTDGECEGGCVFKHPQEHLCPVGCRLEGEGCTPCPAAYDACGIYGGCDPGGELGEEGDTTVDCVCLAGFTGKWCAEKADTVLGHFMLVTVSVLVLSFMCCLHNNGYFVVGRYSWKWPSYQIKPIVGFVMDIEPVVIAIEYIQLFGMAFSSSIPWTDNSSFSSLVVMNMRLLGLSIWPSSWGFCTFGGKLAIISLSLVVMEYLYRQFMRSSFHPHGGTGVDHDHELLVILRRRVEKSRSIVLLLSITPGMRVYSSTFFACTYYQGRDNTFDEDRSISCWTSAWWWWFAIVSLFGMAVLLITALIRDKRLGSMEHSYPATRPFGFVLSMNKILATITAVGMGEFHAKESCFLIIALLATKLIYVVVVRPWAHSFLNRFTFAWVAVNIWCYSIAIYALDLSDSSSSASGNILSIGLLCIVIIYAALEGFLFAQAPSEDHPAAAFGKFHVAWRFPEVYSVSNHGMPVDEDGQTCEDDYDLYTALKKSSGSGKPAALTSEYSKGGKPPRYHKRRDDDEKIKATEIQRRANMAANEEEQNKRDHELWGTENPVGPQTDTENPEAGALESDGNVEQGKPEESEDL